MSSSNILRLLRDALALNNERLDLVSGNVLSVRPNTDDTGSINIGDGTYDMDVKVFVGSSGEYILCDVGNSKLDLKCGFNVTGATGLVGTVGITGTTILTGDLIHTGGLTHAQAAASAEHGDGAIGTGVAPATYRRTVNGTIITEIKIDLTGLDSSGTGNDVIGLASPGTDAAYIGRNVVATNGIIYRVELICLETPATGDADILLVAGSAADETFDDTVANTATLCDTGGDIAAGQMIVNNVPAITANYYYYLTQGGTDNAAYTAGQLLIRTYGHAVLT